MLSVRVLNKVGDLSTGEIGRPSMAEANNK